MRSEQLEYVAAIARLGTFRKAAAELHLSQSALSSTVRNLERELGVPILERGRDGARVSEQGKELLPHITEAIEVLDKLRRAASAQNHAPRVVRIGAVNAATVALLTSAATQFRQIHPLTQVEVIDVDQGDVLRALRDGSLDLGLVTSLEGDDMPPDIDTTLAVRGRAVVCMHVNSPLAALDEVSVDDLLLEPLIIMRAGYLMHRYVHRLLDGRATDISYTTGGSGIGKLMVAEGLGVTVLPDFSVRGDPLLRRGAITYRPLRDDHTEVHLLIQRRRSDTYPHAARDLHRLLVDQAAVYREVYATDAPQDHAPLPGASL